MEPQRLVLEAVGMDHPQEEHDPLFQRTWESCVASMDVYLVNGNFTVLMLQAAVQTLQRLLGIRNNPLLCARSSRHAQGIQGIKRLFHGG